MNQQEPARLSWPVADDAIRIIPPGDREKSQPWEEPYREEPERPPLGPQQAPWEEPFHEEPPPEPTPEPEEKTRTR